MGNLQLGNFLLYLIPATKLNVGDLIKDAGEYYYVIKVENGIIQTMSAKTGEMKTAVPIKNILGLSCYTKIIALDINIGDAFDFESILKGEDSGENGLKQVFALAMMMNGNGAAQTAPEGANGNQLMSLLPLMLLMGKGAGDGNSDMMKLILVMAMMSGNNAAQTVPEGIGNNQLMGLLPLMFLKERNDKPSQNAFTSEAPKSDDVGQKYEKLLDDSQKQVAELTKMVKKLLK